MASLSLRADPSTDGVDIPKLILNGKTIDVRIEGSITSGTLDRTMEGASTVTLTLHDPDLALLQSGIFNKRVIITIDGLTFSLAKVAKQGMGITLTFEDIAVARLRIPKKPRKAVRGKVTRAEFALMLIKELKAPVIPYKIPELHKKQPIARVSATERADNREQGLDSGASVTVKGVKATKEQRSNIERVLDVGRKMDASTKVLQAAVATIIEESSAKNLSGGDRDSVGIFQQRPSQGWPASRNIETDAKAFFTAAIKADKESPGLEVYELAHTVQRNYDTETKGRESYGQWVSEAKKTVEEYGGGSTGGTGGSTGGSAKYEFSRGMPGQPEDSWTALQRLAQEVGWRCFVTNGRLYFVSEDYLMKSKPFARIEPNTLGVHDVDFDYDIGKKVSSARLTVRIARWTAPPGSVVVLERYGPANGRYLVKTISRSLYSSDATIELVRPTPPLPEPQAQQSQSSGSGGSLAGGSTVAGSTAKINADGTASAPEDAPEDVKRMIEAGNQIITKPYSQQAPRTPNTSVLSTYDCSSAVAHVLAGAGKVDANDNVVSGELAAMFESGRGEWVTIYANAGHAYMEIAGIRMDTSSMGSTPAGAKPGSGPRWRNTIGQRSGFTARHPGGL